MDRRPTTHRHRNIRSFLTSKHRDDEVLTHAAAFKLNHAIGREIEVRNSRGDNQNDRFFFEAGFDEFDNLGISHWPLVLLSAFEH